MEKVNTKENLTQLDYFPSFHIRYIDPDDFWFMLSNKEKSVYSQLRSYIYNNIKERNKNCFIRVFFSFLCPSQMGVCLVEKVSSDIVHNSSATSGFSSFPSGYISTPPPGNLVQTFASSRVYSYVFHGFFFLIFCFSFHGKREANTEFHSRMLFLLQSSRPLPCTNRMKDMILLQQ